jgi:hypothetical protein
MAVTRSALLSGRGFFAKIALTGISMSAKRFVTPVLFSLLLTNCGTYVPEIQEPPFGQGAQRELVQAIVTSVHCEVSNAIVDLYNDAKKYPDLILPMTRKMETWGVQMALTLKTRENSVLNPAAAWTPTTLASFTLGASGTLSSEAIRTNILNFYYSVADLRRRGKCLTGQQPEKPVTSLLIQNDLKFKDWLYDQMGPAVTNEVNLPVNTGGPLDRNVLSHEVSFEVVTSGGINPAWILTETTINQGTIFLQATRDRTHTLLITMGPGNNAGLTGAARDAYLASSIGLAVANQARRLR